MTQVDKQHRETPPADQPGSAFDLSGLSENRSAGFLSNVNCNSPVGIVAVDSRGGLLTINPAALKVFDLDKDTIREVREADSRIQFIKTLPGPEKSRWQAMMDQVLTAGQEVSEPRFHHHTRYLQKVLSLKISPLPDLPDGNNGLTMALEDITEKAIVEQYAILSEKLAAHSEMAASVAHELNNHLAIISNNAELMAVNIEREDYRKVKINARSITESVFRTNRFAENLMDFSRPEPECISYDIKHLLNGLLLCLQLQPRFRPVHVTLDLPSSLPPCQIDVGQIQQVLLNLLNNACDALEDRAAGQSEDSPDFSREIEIRAWLDQTDKALSVSISDNGPGMSDDMLGRIFKPDFITGKSRPGIGLSYCREIVEQHGGSLTAASRVDEGATFTLKLPLSQNR